MDMSLFLSTRGWGILLLLCMIMTLPLLSVEGQCVYVTPPVHFQPKMQVAAGCCEYNGKILLLLRHLRKPQGNTWCMPGGKLEEGETPDQALIREVGEEIGLNLTEYPFQYCQRVFIRFPTGDFILHLYHVHLKQKPELRLAEEEHSDMLWVTLEEALALPLIPGGEECLKLIFKNPSRDACALPQSSLSFLDF